MNKIIPLGNRILLKVVKEERKDGLILLNNEKSHYEVVALGKDVEDKTLEINKRVIPEKYALREITHNNEPHFLIKEEDLIAIYA